MEDFSKITIDYEASILDEERILPLRLSQAFLTVPALAPSMLTSHDEIAFDLYLTLLNNFDGNPQSTIEIDYKVLRQALGLDEKLSYASARDKMKQALRRLEERYRLIIRKKRFFQSTHVILLNYPDTTSYFLPQEKYCSIPYEYWLYGWHKTLSFPEKYCYLINLLKGGITRGRLWSGYIIGLSKEFKISRNTLLRGMKGLRQLNIIEMEYSTYAGIVYKGNDIQVIEDIIKKMEEYGIDEVDRAFRIVSEKFAGNPTRNYKYVVGILQTEAKE